MDHLHKHWKLGDDRNGAFWNPFDGRKQEIELNEYKTMPSQ